MAGPESTGAPSRSAVAPLPAFDGIQQLPLFIDRIPLFEDDASDEYDFLSRRKPLVAGESPMRSASPTRGGRSRPGSAKSRRQSTAVAHPPNNRGVIGHRAPNPDYTNARSLGTWAEVRKDIEAILDAPGGGRGGGSSGGAGAEGRSDSASSSRASTPTPTSTTPAGHSSTISFGLSHQQTIPTSNALVRNILHVPAGLAPYTFTPTPEVWAICDEMGVGIWSRGRGRRVNGAWMAKGIVGWKAVAGWAVVAGGDMCLRVLDSRFEEVSCLSVGRPILFIDWVPERNEIVTGEVGFITVLLEIRDQSIIETSQSQQHSGASPTSKKTNGFRSYYTTTAPSDVTPPSTPVYMQIFDWVTGYRVESLRNVHEMSVACLAYHPRLEYLCSGSKDGEIKIWSPQFLPLYTFKLPNSVTSLLLIAPTSPLLMSGSLDGSVRIWDLERGKQTYKRNVRADVKGLVWVGGESVGVWGKRDVEVWGVGRVGGCFVGTNATPQTLSILRHPTHPPRLLTSLSDNSIKLFSPTTGATLTTCFPVHKDVSILSAAADLHHGFIYGLLSSGEVAVWETGRSNPAVLKGVWEEIQPRDRCAAICEVDIYNWRGLGRRFGRMFYLGVGFESGGVGWVGEGGRLEGCVQAHTAPVLFVKFDPQRLWMISGGQDNTIKTWLFAPGTPTPHQPHARPTLTHLHTLTTTFTLPPTLAVSPSRCIIGLPGPGIIKQARYDADGVVEGQSLSADFDERLEVVQSVGDVDWGEGWGLWVGAVGCAVRVWDEGGLIREIQFNEPIRSVCFANTRGDIFVGLPDQISVIRMQDYLPYDLLKLALTRHFPDPMKEDPPPFDPTIDFWEGVYERNLRERGTVGYWHVRREPDPSELQKPQVRSKEETREKDRHSRDVHRRRNRRLYLELEHRAFLKARKFETTASPHKKQVSPIHTEMESDGEHDLVILNRQSSEDVLVELLRTESPSDLVVEEMVPLPPEVIHIPLMPPKPKGRLYIKPTSRRRSERSITRPTRPVSEKETMSKEEVDARRQMVRKTLENQGVVMPNSSVTQTVTPAKKSEAFRRRSIAPQRPPSAATTPAPPGEETSVPPVKYIAPKRQRVQRPPVLEPPVEEQEPGKPLPVVVEPPKPPTPPPPPPLVQQGEDDLLLLPPPSPPMFAEIEVERPPRPPRPKKVRKHKPKKPPPQATKPPFALPPPPVIPPAQPKRPPPAPKPPAVVKPIIAPPPPAPKPAVVAPPPAPSKPKPKPKPKPNPIIAVHLPPKPPPPPPAPSSPPAEQAESTPPTPPSEPDFVLEEVTEEAAAAFAWNLIRAREFKREEDIPQELRKMMGMFWFPHLQGQKPTLQNIVQSLLHLLRTGLWLEKVEAAKALLLLFRTFRSDFIDPLSTLVRPQLEFMDDPSWQVRAQLCCNVGQYGVAGDGMEEVIAALMGRLGDRVEYVRQVALRSLATFGINNKMDLHAAMVRCGLLPATVPPADDIMLNMMLLIQLQKRNDTYQDITQGVVAWLSSVAHSTGYGNRQRRDSYCEHLAGPFFPPDARKNGDGPRGSRQAWEDAADVTGWGDDSGKSALMAAEGDRWAKSFPGRTTETGWEKYIAAQKKLASARAAEPLFSERTEKPQARRSITERAKTAAPVRPVSFRDAMQRVRPMTAGTNYAKGGPKALTGLVQPPMDYKKRPTTAPSLVSRDVVEGLHDRPFRSGGHR
ncbi:uncharacterized protein EV422DRAFT_565327 [Fimicolochytrium jonesii]|uniref:uncharacterized protein n=1 Tax=Fimicolochytrium jonesii TaxID=1396493 RepID=UPI0022FE2EE7|nr:uncharacterized protein EV422DRAFT_565327 [Fimicolochytrium jonesii]KAI8823377.1 hypothetical protein EV422DRAFT_565327 [Fimicolochytrium jonesii]